MFLSVTTHMKKLSKSQNDMTSDKQLRATGPRQHAGQTERRSQSDTAINITTRKASVPDILKPLDQGSPRRLTSPVLKQEDLSSRPIPSTLFSGGLRHASLISINSTCTEMGNFGNANGKRKTGVQKNTVDPTFQETLKYQVEPGQLGTRWLQVSVWHLGMLTRRVFLGEVTIPLATWDFEDRTTQCFCWYPLRAKRNLKTAFFPVMENLQSGPNWSSLQGPESSRRPKKRPRILVSPSFRHRAGLQWDGTFAGPAEPSHLDTLLFPSAVLGSPGRTDWPSPNGQLCLVVLGAKNLPVRSDGTLNSFVKGCLTLPDQHKLNLKSPVAKKQACPQWKHSFVFNGVSPSQLRQSSLALTVWDQAIFGVNDRLLGEAWLGSKEAGAGGEDSGSPSERQWQKVLSSPNLWTDLTLILH
ncbi:hypothetical protein GH733_000125 [Mirounga leonina]|nr:hypothetical protein GH733_000125 [Mirounga leonina]